MLSTPTQPGAPSTLPAEVAQLQLNRETFEALSAVSDDLDLNEIDCAQRWALLTKRQNLQFIEQHTGINATDLEANPAQAVR